MSKYKVFIPCAGLGSRLNLKYNKALVTVGHKPVIAHILDKFNTDIEIVIALGYDGDNVRQVLDVLYPDRKITYVNINPYEGEGSGLGLTLIQSSKYLQCPFIFCPCDTIIDTNSCMIPPPEYNWMGYAHLVGGPPDIQYRSFRTEKSEKLVTEICSKEVKGPHLYIGLCGIFDYEIFWQSMKEGQDVGSIESGEVYGLKHILKRKIHAQPFTWLDTGSPNSLEETRQTVKSWSDDITANILPKDNEAIWFVNIGQSSIKKVVKFSTDMSFIKNRVKRAHALIPYVPFIENDTENVYVYNMQDGDVLSNCLTLHNFNKLLNCLTKFWQPVTLDKCYGIDSACQAFYINKTTTRIKQYFKTFEQIDQAENINGIDVPSIWTILEKIDGTWICDGLPTKRFHGDLHFENILIDKTDDRFIFLDWRQDFAGLMGHGDLYYDLAKLNHGIIMSHELVDKKLFSHSMINNVVKFDFLRKNISVEIEQRFREFVSEQGYDYKKVQYLTYLIFLNIAALHHYPYGLLLFHLGKSGLWQLLEHEK